MTESVRADFNSQLIRHSLVEAFQLIGIHNTFPMASGKRIDIEELSMAEYLFVLASVKQSCERFYKFAVDRYETLL